MAAAGVISGLQSLVSRNISPLNNTVLTIGTINGGTKGNIIADEVRMTGTLRTLDPETRAFAAKRIKELAEHIAEGYGCSAEVVMEWGFASLINTDEVVDLMLRKAEEILGKEHVVLKKQPSMGGEDFSYFIDGSKKGGAFYNLGCGNAAKGITAGLHNKEFDVDESCIGVGMRMQTEFLLELLK